MIVWLRHFLGWVVGAFRSREDIILENLALRQQLLALHAQRPRRRLTASHKLFWVVLRRLWDKWKEPLILVTAGISDHVWSIEELCELLPQAESVAKRADKNLLLKALAGE